MAHVEDGQRRLRIAQIVPIGESVPPAKYGGIPRVASILTEELVARGHKVTLFAAGNSKTSANLISVTPENIREPRDKRTIYNMKNIYTAYGLQDQFDIIHDHTIDLSLPTADESDTPVVVTLHTVVTPERAALHRRFSNLTYIPISEAQVADYPGIYPSAIYNGLDLENFPFGEKPNPQEYLLFVGRIDPIKGVSTAIEVAKKAGLPLIIAAKLDELPHTQEYFHNEIEPQLDGQQIKWIGEVSQEERNELMKGAKALLHPNMWNEPFGLVLIEAMACGTPVIARNRGSIPEIVIDGETGFIAETVEEMVDAVKKIDTISRGYCRHHAISNFSATSMVDNYEALYYQLLEERLHSLSEAELLATESNPSISYASVN